MILALKIMLGLVCGGVLGPHMATTPSTSITGIHVASPPYSHGKLTGGVWVHQLEN